MPRSTVRACIDVAVPDELLLEAMRRAIAENPNNAPAINPRLLPQGVKPDVSSVFLAAITGKLWQPGRVLRVRFLDGDPKVQERIPPFAHQWSDYANITFQFVVDPDAEIRISFRNQGSWSYLGTDALVIPKSQPTMNFGWLTAATANDEYLRLVTHEFGHALGCIHEHQNPATNIPWDREAVYRYYQGPPNYWSREQVDINLFTRYEADITQFSDFDRQSIMLYPIPNEFTLGDFEIGWNQTLSELDKQFIGTIYPANRKATSVLEVDAPPLDATIGEFGEVDTFTFTIVERSDYRLETTGVTDVVMSLFGPGSDTRPVAVDDDSGEDRNARITINLRPGDYTVRVRHFSTQKTGGYRISLHSTSKQAAPPSPPPAPLETPDAPKPAKPRTRSSSKTPSKTPEKTPAKTPRKTSSQKASPSLPKSPRPRKPTTE